MLLKNQHSIRRPTLDSNSWSIEYRYHGDAGAISKFSSPVSLGIAKLSVKPEFLVKVDMIFCQVNASKQNGNLIEKR